MAMGRSYKDLEQREKERAEGRRRAERPQTELWEQEAMFHIALFNHRLTTKYPVTSWPTLQAALLTRHYTMKVLCPACNQEGWVDLRKSKCAPHQPISALIPALRCQRCGPSAPAASVTGLIRWPWENKDYLGPPF